MEFSPENFEQIAKGWSVEDLEHSIAEATRVLQEKKWLADLAQMDLEDSVRALNEAQAELNYWYYLGPSSACGDGLDEAGRRIKLIQARIDELIGE